MDVDAGDALGMERGEVVGVVFERQPQVEAEGSQLLDTVPLEPGDLWSVTAAAWPPSQQSGPRRYDPADAAPRSWIYVGDYSPWFDRNTQRSHSVLPADRLIEAATVGCS